MTIKFCDTCGEECDLFMICSACTFLLGILAKYQWGLKS